MSEGTAKSGSSLRRFAYYLLVVVIVVCVAFFLIGRYQMGKAERIRLDAEVKLTQATVYIADDTMQNALAAQRDVSNRNWGSARQAMASVVEGVSVMEQIAPKDMSSQIADLKRKAINAQTAVAENSNESLGLIADALQVLQKIKERPLTG